MRSNDRKIEVAEFPKIQGPYDERDRFMVYDTTGKLVFCVTLESDLLAQPVWAKAHPMEATASGRQFSLDGYASDSHATYGFYNGEPPYDQVRDEVKQVLSGKRLVISRTNYASPQPIPGEQ